MIQINNKKIQIDVDGEYTYRFYSTDSCSVSFSNPTGTTTNSIIETNIVFGSETCFTAAQNSLFLEVSTSTLCSTIHQLTITSPCSWINTITGITKTGEYEYLAAFPSPDPNSGSTGAYFYNWEYDTNIFTEIVTNDPRVLRLEVKGSISTGINYPVSVLINDSSTGCEVYQTYNETFCQPTVENELVTLGCVINDDDLVNKLVFLQGSSCDSSIIDWNTLIITGNNNLLYAEKQNNISTDSTIIIYSDITLPVNSYNLGFTVKDSKGIESAMGTIQIITTDCIANPNILNVEPLILPIACSKATGFLRSFNGDFTGMVDTVYLINPPLQGTVTLSANSQNDAVEMIYETFDYNTTLDSFDIQIEYKGLKSNIFTVDVEKTAYEITSVVQNTVCNNNLHTVDITFSYDIPTGSTIPVIFYGKVGNSPSSSIQLTGQGVHTLSVSNVECTGTSQIAELKIGTGTCSPKEFEYTTPSGQGFFSGIGYSMYNVDCTANTATIAIQGNYFNIQGGYLDIVINGVTVSQVGTSGSCNTNLQMNNTESGFFVCANNIDTTTLPATFDVVVLSTVDNTVIETITNISNPC